MLQDIVSQYKDSFAPGSSTELRAQRNLTRRVTLISGSLTNNQRTDVGGIGARAYRDGVYGFASAADLSAGAAKRVLENATENAELLSRHAGRGTGSLPEILRGSERHLPEYPDLPQKSYIDYLQGLDSYLSAKYPALESRTLVA